MLILKKCFQYFYTVYGDNIVWIKFREIFTSKLEEILLSWQLSLKDKEEKIIPVQINGEWQSLSEDINFAGK